MTRILTITLLLLCATGWGQLNKPLVQTVPGQVTGLGNFVEYGNKSEMDYNAQADSLFARFDVMPTVPVKEAISQLFDTLNTYHICCGATDSLDTFYDFALNTLNNAKLSWTSRKASHPYDATMLDSVLFYPYIGYRKAQYAGSMSSNFNPRTAGGHYKTNSASLGVHIYDDKVSKLGEIQIGSYNATDAAITQLLFGNNKQINQVWLNSGAGTNPAITPSSFHGTVNMVRTSSSNIYIYKGQTRYTISNNSLVIPNKILYIGSSNYNTGNAKISNGTTSFAWIGGQLTQTQSNKLDLALERYRSKAMRYYDFYWSETNAYYKTPNSNRIGYCYDVLAVNGNMKLAHNADTLYFSIDNGLTYPYKKYLANANQWTSAVIFDNADILVFTTQNKVWKSKDNLQTLTELTVKNVDGTNFTIHTPVNSIYKGNYFGTTHAPKKYWLHGKQVALIPSYSNVALGASPANCYMAYSADSIKAVYRSGIDSSYRDNGTPSGSASTGNYIGVAYNPYKHRHLHSAELYGDTMLLCTGDTYKEIMWLKGVYNAVADSFVWTKLINGYVSPTERNEYMSGFTGIIGDTLYFVSDANMVGHFGAYKIRIQDIGIKSATKTWEDGNKLFLDSWMDSDGTLWGATLRKVIYSTDRGFTWKVVYTKNTHYVSDGGYYAYTYFMGKDNLGWQHLYTNYRQTMTGTEVLLNTPTVMIKPK